MMYGVAAGKEQGARSIFDAIEEEERERMINMPASNAFEETTRWTRDGKLWTFPIDNDQGLHGSVL